MSLAATALLILVHSIYRFVSFARHAWRSLARRRLRVDAVAPTLSKTPRHLALVIAHGRYPTTADDVEAMLESATRVAGWCEQLQIPSLSVYDRNGILLVSAGELGDRLDAERVEHAASAHTRERLQHPLTPPPSEHSEANSRAWSPELEREAIVTLRLAGPRNGDTDDAPLGLRKRRRSSRPDCGASSTSLTVRVLSRDAGKPQLASVARALAEQSLAAPTPREAPSVEQLDALIFEMTGLPEVDLMIVHPLSGSSNRPLEMHGFPPWQMRLAEIYHTAPRPFSLPEWWRGAPRALTEDAFCRALREFGGAEQRLGK